MGFVRLCAIGEGCTRVRATGGDSNERVQQKKDALKTRLGNLVYSLVAQRILGASGMRPFGGSCLSRVLRISDLFS